jgi:GTPase
MNESVSVTQRTAAIVGRPNVGKSALFNRLVRRRLAIVHEESGVTRDRLAAEVNWRQQQFELIDTGGVSVVGNATAPDVITAGIQRQVDVALADAPVAILTVDGVAGLQPLDREVAALLRRQERAVVVAVNKVDHDGLLDAALEFSALGFPVFPVSALHNRGMDALLEAVTALLPDTDNPTAKDPLKVAVVGRPNVGKSSYINRLLNSDRVIVSDIPGTTRDSVEIPFAVGSGPQARTYLLTDTAGMRRKGKINDMVERFSLMRAEKSIERADVVVMMLDAAQGPTAMDKTIAAKIIDKRKGIVIAVNKWDLAEAGEVTQRAYTKALSDAVPFLGFAPIVYLSAQSGYNIRKSIEVIDHVAAQVNHTLGTGLLNRVLHEAFERVQPPVSGNRRLKLYYATQVGNRPVRIRLFVNEPRLAAPAYKTYIIRVLRETFGLDGAPLILQFKGKEKRDAKA